MTQKEKRQRGIIFTLISIIHVMSKLDILQRLWQHVGEQIQLIYNTVTGGDCNKWILFSYVAHTLIRMQIVLAKNQSISPPACQRDPRCRSVSCPCATCKGSTGWGHDNLTGLGCISDECGGGRSPACSPLSAREQRPHSTHNCRGRRGEREASRPHGDWRWQRGHQTRYSKAFVEAICFTIRSYFQRDRGARFAEFTTASCLLPVGITPKCDWHSTFYILMHPESFHSF